MPAPLVIGVTGHRDLRQEDLEKLEEKVWNRLAKLRRDYLFTPFVLLSPLAEGADRLVARIALRPEIGARLVVPLPMRQELYEKDFQPPHSDDPNSLPNFRQLLKCAEYSFAMPLGADEDEVSHPGPARDRQYQEMGKYIARESHILFALWDGKRLGKTGGTAEIVDFQLGRSLENPDCCLQPPESFPVYHIVTPRKSNPHPEIEPYQLIRKYAEGFARDAEAEKYYATIFRNLDDFNYLVRKGGDWLLAQATESKAYLLGGLEAAKLSRMEILDADRYAVADALAQTFRRKVDRTHRWLHWLVFVGFIFFVLFSHLPGHPPWSLICALFALMVSLFVYRRHKNLKVDNKSQDYRALAEGSRVRFFWDLGTIHDSVKDNYLGKQRTELDWIRNALRSWELTRGAAAGSSPQTSIKRLQAVQTLWVEGQIQYFEPTIERHEKKLNHMEALITICGVGFFIALVFLVATVAHEAAKTGFLHIEESAWIRWEIIAVDFFLGAVALLHHATQQKAYPQHMKNFRRAETIYRKALEIIGRRVTTNDSPGVKQCLTNLGREALSENGDWVLLHRERPLELPHP